mgnify:CR=1 FL=1|tara:strand:- start:815 stop:1201 length:387 start_codon:yes stop_codon:yes gene_type:complete
MTEFRYLNGDEAHELVPYALQHWDDTRSWKAVADEVLVVGQDLHGFNIGSFMAHIVVTRTKAALLERQEAFEKNAMLHLCDEEIVDLFDLNPDLTIAEISEMTGKSTSELKQLIMEAPQAKIWGGPIA